MAEGERGQESHPYPTQEPLVSQSHVVWMRTHKTRDHRPVSLSRQGITSQCLSRDEGSPASVSLKMRDHRPVFLSRRGITGQCLSPDEGSPASVSLKTRDHRPVSLSRRGITGRCLSRDEGSPASVSLETKDHRPVSLSRRGITGRCPPSLFFLSAHSEVEIAGQHLRHSQDGEHNGDVCSGLQIFQNSPLFHLFHFTPIDG